MRFLLPLAGLTSVLAAAFQPVATNPVPAAEDSVRLFLPEDLQATVWAESPQLFNPTNIDVDYRGRIWVTEAVDYRDFNNKDHLSHPAGERVVILEDTDQDGKADKSSVFVEDKELVSPLGIAVIGKQVLVSAAPNLFVYTDTDGDDKADKKETLLTGFGGLDHDHSLHSVVAGPDGYWYFNVGNAGPHNVTDRSGWTLHSGSLYTGGTPYNKTNNGGQKSDDGRVWTGGLMFRIRPDGTGLRVVGHNFRNSFETCLDSYGSMWQNDNDDQVIACRTSYLIENGNAGYFSADGSRYWQADRRPGQDVFTAHWHQDDPGVMPVPENTGAGSPTGIAFYESDLLGPKYRGMLLSAEAGRNVIYAYWPQKNGAGFDLKRHNLVSSLPEDNVNYKWNDNVAEDRRKWFRPSDVLAGTDGALYIADWYDPIVGGHAMHDKKGFGRIYRITPKNRKLPAPKLDFSTLDGLEEGLRSPAVNVRNAAFTGLVKQGKAALPVVQRLLKDPNPYIRARAIYLLPHIGGDMSVLLGSPDPGIRLVAFRAVRATGDFLPAARILATDADPAVRREVAISLRDVPLDQCQDILRELARRFDGKDDWMRVAMGTALDGSKAGAFYPELLKLFPQPPEKWPLPLARLVFETHPVAAIPALKTRAGSSAIPAGQRKQALTALAFIRTRPAAEAMVALSKSPLPDVAEQALWWLNFRKTNDWADLVDWKETTAQLSPAHQKMLKLQVEVTGEHTMDERIAAALEMAKDPIGGKMLVGLAAENRLPGPLRKAIGKKIFENPDASVRTLASDYFPREGRNYSIDIIARRAPDPSRGKTLFEKNCMTCHKHGTTGAEIGPDLSTIHQKMDRLALIDAVVNPSAALVFGYEPWLITTRKGDTIYGFLVSDGATVVLRDAAGKQIAIRKDQIKDRKALKTSLMPDPAALGLSEDDISDITGYLLSFQKH
ncbi:MAG: c-type cytochrome [Siphonobacter aquaeclarae]|nr:c-type cytochrome [Siphonobacter aquaeclarae]